MASGSYLNTTSVNAFTTKHIIFIAICHQKVNKINATKILILNRQLLCWNLCSEIFVIFLTVYQEKLFLCREK